MSEDCSSRHSPMNRLYDELWEFSECWHWHTTQRKTNQRSWDAINPWSQWQNLGNYQKITLTVRYKSFEDNKDCNTFGVNVTWLIKFVEFGHRYDKALPMWNFNIWWLNWAHLQHLIWPHYNGSTSRGRSFPTSAERSYQNWSDKTTTTWYLATFSS